MKQWKISIYVTINNRSFQSIMCLDQMRQITIIWTLNHTPSNSKHSTTGWSGRRLQWVTVREEVRLTVTAEPCLTYPGAQGAQFAVLTQPVWACCCCLALLRTIYTCTGYSPLAKILNCFFLKRKTILSFTTSKKKALCFHSCSTLWYSKIYMPFPNVQFSSNVKLGTLLRDGIDS